MSKEPTLATETKAQFTKRPNTLISQLLYDAATVSRSAS
jgi:hypothetical protein